MTPLPKAFNFVNTPAYIFVMNSYTRYTLKMRKEKIRKTFKSYTIYTITSHQFKQYTTQQLYYILYTVLYCIY